MKIKTGDFVRFVDEAIEGHVTSFQGNDIIGVTDDSGFEIPVLISKVTLVHGSMQSVEDREDDLTIRDSNTPFVQEGVYLAVAGDQHQGLATFFVVNETSYELPIAISQVNPNVKVLGIYSGVVAPKNPQKFYTSNFSNIGKWPTFQIQLLKYSANVQTPHPPLSKQIRFKLSDLSNAKSRLDVLEEKAWIQQLDKSEEDLKLERLGNWGKLK